MKTHEYGEFHNELSSKKKCILTRIVRTRYIIYHYEVIIASLSAEDLLDD